MQKCRGEHFAAMPGLGCRCESAAPTCSNEDAYASGISSGAGSAIECLVLLTAKHKMHCEHAALRPKSTLAKNETAIKLFHAKNKYIILVFAVDSLPVVSSKLLIDLAHQTVIFEQT